MLLKAQSIPFMTSSHTDTYSVAHHVSDKKKLAFSFLSVIGAKAIVIQEASELSDTQISQPSSLTTTTTAMSIDDITSCTSSCTSSKSAPSLAPTVPLAAATVVAMPQLMHQSDSMKIGLYEEAIVKREIIRDYLIRHLVISMSNKRTNHFNVNKRSRNSTKVRTLPILYCIVTPTATATSTAVTSHYFQYKSTIFSSTKTFSLDNIVSVEVIDDKRHLYMQQANSQVDEMMSSSTSSSSYKYTGRVSGSSGHSSILLTTSDYNTYNSSRIDSNDTIPIPYIRITNNTRYIDIQLLQYELIDVFVLWLKTLSILSKTTATTSINSINSDLKS